MPLNSEIRRLSSPSVFLVGMAAFLVLVGFVVSILYKQIVLAFNANPGLNGLIIGVLVIGALFAFRQILRLFREIRWVNSLSNSQVRPPKYGPRLLGPMATLINAGAGARGLPTATTRAILDSVGTRLDEGRELNATIRKSLDARVTALRESWLARIGRALEEDRIVEALQVASRAPEPAMRLPADLAVKLSDAAGSAMRSDLDDQQWLQMLEAVVGSPVRRTVKPAGIPSSGNESVLSAARHAAGSVPQLARLLGLPIPPPPGPRRPPRQLGPARRPAPA